MGWSIFEIRFDNNEDNVIPCTGTLNDRPPSLLPLPVDGSGQRLLSLESTSLSTVQMQVPPPRRPRRGANRRGWRGGSICGSEHGFTSSLLSRLAASMKTFFLNVLESHPEQAAPLSRRDDRYHDIVSHSALALRLHLAACSPSSSCRF